MGTALVTAGRHFTTVFRLSTYRRIALISAFLYLLTYLYSIRHIVFLRGVALPVEAVPAFQVVPDWSAKLGKTIAPYAYEPLAALYLTPQLTIFLAPVNLLLGLMLGTLVGINLALAVHQFKRQRACHRPTVSGFLGSLPSLLTGFTCCVPTVALVLGANSVLALIALRAYLVPVSTFLLVAGALWGAWRGSQAHPILPPIGRASRVPLYPPAR